MPEIKGKVFVLGMNTAQGNRSLLDTRLCLCRTASFIPGCAVLETLVFLQNAYRTVNGVSSLDSPVCLFASGQLEITPVAHGFYVPWLKWESQMCKDQVRKKSSMSSIQEWFHACRYPPPIEVLGVCPNCLCRNCCTANRRQYCVIAIIDYTWWTPLIQSLFLILVQGNMRSQEQTNPLDLGDVTSCICTSSVTMS